MFINKIFYASKFIIDENIIIYMSYEYFDF